MTDTSAAAAALDSDQMPRGRRRTVWVGASAAGLLLVGTLGWGGWWLTHPTVFDEPGSTQVGSERTPAFGGEKKPLLLDMAVLPSKASGSVTLKKAEPHVVTNTANATITFHVCITNGREAIVSVRGRLARWCDEVHEIDGAEWQLDREPRHQLLMAIWDAEPGELRVEGVDLTYRDGLQRGTQQTGAAVWFSFV